MTKEQITHLQDMIDDFFSETQTVKQNNKKGKTGAIKRNKNK